MPTESESSLSTRHLCVVPNCYHGAAREGQLCSNANHPEIVAAGVAPTPESEFEPCRHDGEAECVRGTMGCDACRKRWAWELSRSPEEYVRGASQLQDALKHAVSERDALRARVAELEALCDTMIPVYSAAMKPGATHYESFSVEAEWLKEAVDE